MNEVYEFLKSCGTWYIATVDENNEARVRPFGAQALIEGKFYFGTGLKKDVAKQMAKNPNIEICGFNGQEWMRVHGPVELVDDIAIQTEYLNQNESLKAMYTPGDGNTAVYRFKCGTATIYSFTGEPKVIKF